MQLEFSARPGRPGKRQTALALCLALAACSTNGAGVDTDGGPGADGGSISLLQFTSLGPRHANGSSGQIGSIALHPTDPKIMLIASGLLGPASGAGLYRTTDGGATWTPVVAGLVGADGLTAGTVNVVWINPARASEAFAGTAVDGIFRSTDGGVTWSLVDKTTAIRGFASVSGSVLAASSAGVLGWSAANGTWSVAQATATPVLTIAALGATALAGTDDGSVFGLTDGKWTLLGKAPTAVIQLAINPANAKIVYGAGPANYGNSLYVSQNGGAPPWTSVGWPRVPQYPMSEGLLGVQVIAFSAVHAGRLYVAGDGKTDITTGDGNANPVYDHTAIFASNPLGLNLDTRALYLVPNAAGTDDRCFVASDQGIAAAEQCSVPDSPVVARGNGLSTNLVRDFAVSPDGLTLIAMMQDFSAASSTDGGATWRATPVGENGHAAINPAMPSRCYAYKDAFFYSDGCGAGSFIKSADPFGWGFNTTANDFAFDPSDPATFYVVVASPPSIQKTTNSGMSFTPVAWPFLTPSLVAVAPKKATHILAADGAKLSVSFDGGGTWATSTQLPATGTISVAMSPRDDNTVLAAVYEPSASTVMAYRSTDGGKSFALVATVVPASAWKEGGGTLFGGVVYSPSSGSPHAVITTANGAYLSSDDGDHWQRLDTKLITSRFTSTHFAGGYLYLGTFGQGILRSTTPVE